MVFDGSKLSQQKRLAKSHWFQIGNHLHLKNSRLLSDNDKDVRFKYFLWRTLMIYCTCMKNILWSCLVLHLSLNYSSKAGCFCVCQTFHLRQHLSHSTLSHKNGQARRQIKVIHVESLPAFCRPQSLSAGKLLAIPLISTLQSSSLKHSQLFSNRNKDVRFKLLHGEFPLISICSVSLADFFLKSRALLCLTDHSDASAKEPVEPAAWKLSSGKTSQKQLI